MILNCTNSLIITSTFDAIMPFLNVIHVYPVLIIDKASSFYDIIFVNCHKTLFSLSEHDLIATNHRSFYSMSHRALTCQSITLTFNAKNIRLRILWLLITHFILAPMTLFAHFNACLFNIRITFATSHHFHVLVYDSDAFVAVNNVVFGTVMQKFVVSFEIGSALHVLAFVTLMAHETGVGYYESVA